MPDHTTIAHVLDYLAPNQDLETLCCWPPDAFAIAAFLLHKTGAYRVLVMEDYWQDEQSADWFLEVKRIARQWKQTAPGLQEPPPETRAWWNLLLARRAQRLQDTYADRDLCRALLDLCATSDQACAAVGVPIPLRSDDLFTIEANGFLGEDLDATPGKSSTLCLSINPWVLSVLPKLHTPQTGMTLRSLTHHLALCEVGEVSAQWAAIPSTLAEDNTRHGLNLLLVPWPESVSPLQFRAAANDRCGRHQLADNYGYFHYQGLDDDDWPVDRFAELVRAATRTVGRIDGVVLPELSVPSEEVYERLYQRVIEINPDAFLVAGVGVAGDGEETESENYVLYTVPLYGQFPIRFKQDKHHRWQLNGSQVQQYGLGHRLDPSVSWWEHINLSSRKVYFFSAAPWLTFCFLICEDLARQDPIANLLRAVGPNLIIALLMDGPQLKSRWPARYATVLADDPGSSVLTLTSIGMALRSRQSDRRDDRPASRSIALWKDGKSETREIELDPDAGGVILTLARRYEEEFTADGRDDEKATAYLMLCDVIQVPLPAPAPTQFPSINSQTVV